LVIGKLRLHRINFEEFSRSLTDLKMEFSRCEDVLEQFQRI
jgi:hypothetical protein